MKIIRFIGDSLRTLKSFPDEARQDAGYELARQRFNDLMQGRT